MKINVVGGRGQIGGLHARILEEAGHDVVCTDHETSIKPEDAAQMSDVTIISVPIDQTELVMQRVGPYVNALLDFTGVKMKPMDWMQDSLRVPSTSYAGGHPLYGPKSFCDGVLTTVETFAVVKPEEYDANSPIEEVLSDFSSVGIDVLEISAADHDYAMAVVQNARTLLVGVYGKLVDTMKYDDVLTHRISPPPARKLHGLFERQMNHNPDLYIQMRQYNPFQAKVDEMMIEMVSDAIAHPEKYLVKISE